MISAFRIYGLSETEAKGFHDNKANQILHTVGQLKFGVLFGIFLVWTLSKVLATVRFEIYRCVFLHSLLVKKEIILIYTRNSAIRDILVYVLVLHNFFPLIVNSFKIQNVHFDTSYDQFYVFYGKPCYYILCLVVS